MDGEHQDSTTQKIENSEKERYERKAGNLLTKLLEFHRHTDNFRRLNEEGVDSQSSLTCPEGSSGLESAGISIGLLDETMVGTLQDVDELSLFVGINNDSLA